MPETKNLLLRLDPQLAEQPEDASSPEAAAAWLLSGIVRRRPFRHGNRAAGWLAAALTLETGGCPATLDGPDVVALVDAIERDALSADDVAARLTANRFLGVG